MKPFTFECRNCSKLEQQAIAEVIINRTKHKSYPSTICEVTQQPWQFSFKNHLEDKSQTILPEFQSIPSKLDRAAYLQIEKVAGSVLSSTTNEVLSYNVTHYHAKSIKRPYWAISKKFKEVTKGVDKSFKHRYYSVIN